MDKDAEALYREGRALCRDPATFTRGRALLEKAARLGYAPAAAAYGFYLMMGASRKDQARGFALTKEAAEAGDGAAMGNLANCYLYGRGTKKDRRLAKLWYEKAAALGRESSMMQLGVLCHEDGNDDRAIALFRASAEKGFAPAMGWLAACYYNGWGTDEDPGMARLWLEKAAAAGDGEAREALARYFGNNA